MSKERDLPSGTQGEDVAASLEALEAANRRLAEHMRWPLWRHMAGGLLMSLILAAFALQPAPLGFVLFGLALLLSFAIVRDDKKRHGMFVSGYQRGRTGWVMAGILALFFGNVVLLLIEHDGSAGDPLLWLVLLVQLGGTTALGLLWERIYRADLRRGLS